MRKFIEDICEAIEETYKSGDLGLLITLFLISIIAIIIVGWMTFMHLTSWGSNACLAASIIVSIVFFVATLISMACYSEE